MPLARILTLNPDDANEFAQQLYDLGFEVEVANPHRTPQVPADLEIEFAICDQQQVLARAAAIATQLQADVVVFPRAVPPVPRSLALAMEAEEAARRDPLQDQLAEAIQSAEPPDAMHDHRLTEHPDPSEFLTAGPESANTVTEQAQQAHGPSLIGRIYSAMVKQLEHLGAVLSPLPGRVKRILSSAGSVVGKRVYALQQDVKMRIGKARAAREQRMEEIRRQRETAAQHETALDQERERQFAVDHQQELQRVLAERETLMGEIERLRAENRAQSAELEQARLMVPSAAASVTLNQAQSTHAVQPQESMRVAAIKAIHALPRRLGQMRGALAGAAAAMLLFLAGLVWANFHAIRPLSGSLNNTTVEQQVPFGATTVHGPPGATVGGASAPRAAQTRTTPAPKPGNDASPTRRSVAPTKPSPVWHHFRNDSGANEDSLAEDVVIKHFASQNRVTTQTAQQRAGIKRYSDE